jgi:hypothetical protein
VHIGKVVERLNRDPLDLVQCGFAALADKLLEIPHY